MPDTTSLGTTVNVSVDVTPLLGPLTATLGAVSGMLSSINEARDYMRNLNENMTEIRDCIVHLHDAHMHDVAHTCEDRFDVGCGSAVLPSPISVADLLVREFQNSLDQDNNGMIYGRDFRILRSDNLCPPKVRELDNIPFNWSKNEITWQSYLSTLPDEYK